MVRKASRRKPTAPWHEGFLKLLPIIRLHAAISFRRLDPEARAEAVQNCVSNAMIAYLRLYELNKLDLAYAGALARYAVAQTREGRMVGSRSSVRDVSSRYAQVQRGLLVERLDHFDKVESCWQEVLVEDRRAGPADIVRTKLDFGAWLRSLSTKRRRIAKTLATGESTTATATKFGLSLGRISQIRAELCESWRQFVGETPLNGSAAALA